MADGGKVVIQIDGDTSGFNKAIGTVGNIAKTGATVALGAITAIGSGITALGVVGVNYNKQIETYTTNFGVMLGDTALAIEKVEQLKEMGARTPFELPELASATEQLLAFGVANEDTQGYLQQLGDISLGNVDKLNTLVSAFGKMNSTGKVTLETINMMAEQGFNPLQEISRTTGESMESLYERVSDGAISLDEITTAFGTATSAGGQFNEGMAKASQTTDGLISTLKDNATALVGEVFMPISDSILSDVLPSAITGIETLSTAFKENGVEGLIDAGGDLLGGLISGIIDKLPDIANMAVKILESLVSQLNKNSSKIAQSAGLLLTALAKGIFTLLPMLAETAINLILDFGKYLAENAGELVDGVIAMMITLTNLIIENLPEIIVVAIEIITAIVEALAENAPLLVDSAIMLTGALIEGLINSLPSILTAIGELVMSVFEFLFSFYGRIFEYGADFIGKLLEGFTSAWSAVKEWGSSAITEFIGFFEDLPNKIAETLGRAVGHVIQFGKDLIEWAKTKPKEFIDDVVDFFKKLPSKIWDWLGETIDKVADFGSDLISTAKTEIPKFVQEVVDEIKKLPDKLYSIGEDIVEGLFEGISSSWDWLTGKVEGLVDSFVGGVKDVLGIQSPSKVFEEEVGEMVPAGMAKGVEKGIPNVKNALTSMLDIDAMQSIATQSMPTIPVMAGGYNGYAVNNTVTKEIGTISVTSDIYLDSEVIGHAVAPTVNTDMASYEDIDRKGRF